MATRGKSEAGDEFGYGPFHRIQDKSTNDKMAASGTLRGRAAKNIYAGAKPYAKAYFGALPKGQSGVEFLTQVAPGKASDPNQARWGESDEGVRVITRGEEVEIRVRITRRRDE
jgi:hypothetical protein